MFESWKDLGGGGGGQEEKICWLPHRAALQSQTLIYFISPVEKIALLTVLMYREPSGSEAFSPARGATASPVK